MAVISHLECAERQATQDEMGSYIFVFETSHRAPIFNFGYLIDLIYTNHFIRNSDGSDKSKEFFSEAVLLQFQFFIFAQEALAFL